MDEQLLAIARRLGFPTLEARNSDRLDFREAHVVSLKEALEAAYEAGQRAAQGQDAYMEDGTTGQDRESYADTQDRRSYEVDPALGDYALQRDDGRFLTPAYLRWSEAVQDAQRTDPDEAKAIQGWLATIGVRVRISRLSSE